MSKRKDEAPTHYRAENCELRACICGAQGGADVAIQDRAGNVMGYACQTGYLRHLIHQGRDQWSQWKETGTCRTS